MNEFKSWRSYKQFAWRVQHENRYFLTPEDDKFLQEIRRTSKSRIRKIPAEFPLWRAQLGHAWRPIYEDHKPIAQIPTQYPPDRMKPLMGRAKEGRANPKGIPVLYLSTSMDTAMSEVRPWIGSYISCASFFLVQDLDIVDLSVNHNADTTIYFSEPDAPKKEEVNWTHIDKAFSKPTTSQDDTAEYVPTQLIAELFKNEGYDGLAYKSAFGDDGYSMVLFDLDNAELGSCRLFTAKSLAFEFDESDNPYWVSNGGNTKRMNVEAVQNS